MSGANVHVAGLIGNDMGGLKESQGKFRKHHQEVGDALNNLADGVDKEEPRPPYAFKKFPMMIYHADGREHTIEARSDSEVELKQYLAAGFRQQPYPKPKVFVSTPELEKKSLMDTNTQLQGQITQANDIMAKQREMLDDMKRDLEALKMQAAATTDDDKGKKAK